MGGGVEMKMETFRDKMVMKTATKKRKLSTEAFFF